MLHFKDNIRCRQRQIKDRQRYKDGEIVRGRKRQKKQTEKDRAIKNESQKATYRVKWERMRLVAKRPLKVMNSN